MNTTFFSCYSPFVLLKIASININLLAADTLQFFSHLRLDVIDLKLYMIWPYTLHITIRSKKGKKKFCINQSRPTITHMG